MKIYKQKQKFDVGDKIVGIHPDRYKITRLGWIGYVIRVDKNMIWVSDNKFPYSDEYDVDPDYFEIVNKKEPEIISHISYD